jgi:tetratricopeptide (TPR) repeat protein
MAGDVQEAAGGARVSGLGPAPEGDRFLPSVVTLEASMRAGKQSLADGRLGEALGHFNAALKLKPRYDVAWIARGQVLKLQGDLDEALKSFAEALVLKPENEDAWIALAGVLHRMKRAKEEVEAYDQVLRLNPRNVEALINKGAALHALRKYSEAEACYDSVLAARPEYGPAWNNKGAALLRRGKVDEALDAFDRATRLDPDFFDAHVNRAFAWQRKGKHGHAVIAADRALKIREAPWLWTLKGLSHLGLLESSLAARCFERALALDPKQKEARASLRKAKELRGRVDLYRGAYECFGTFEAGDPGCAECEIQARCVEVTK